MAASIFCFMSRFVFDFRGRQISPRAGCTTSNRLVFVFEKSVKFAGTGCTTFSNALPPQRCRQSVDDAGRVERQRKRTHVQPVQLVEKKP
jgi:hypothetical protein